MRSEPQLGGQSHPESRSGAEDGGAVDAPGHLARVDGGAPVVTIPARQARAFRVIDNRTSELTSWDIDLLPDALAGLDDLDIFSFDDAEDTTVRTWMGWSSRHKWVSRANARDAWLTRVSDEQIVANLKACHLALTTRAHGFLTANDGAEKSGSSTLADRIDLLLSALEILPLETPVDRHYGAARRRSTR